MRARPKREQGSEKGQRSATGHSQLRSRTVPRNRGVQRPDKKVSRKVSILHRISSSPRFILALPLMAQIEGGSRGLTSHWHRLLGIGSGVKGFTAALVAQLSAILNPPPTDGSMADRWRKRWPKASRPLVAWAQDFCDIRGAAAHGSKSTAERFVWTAGRHLAFTSILFPLIFKKRLVDHGAMTFESGDLEQLQGIEELLMVDPFSKDSLALVDDNSHPWSEFQSCSIPGSRQAV